MFNVCIYCLLKLYVYAYVYSVYILLLYCKFYYGYVVFILCIYEIESSVGHSIELMVFM